MNLGRGQPTGIHPFGYPYPWTWTEDTGGEGDGGPRLHYPYYPNNYPPPGYVYNDPGDGYIRRDGMFGPAQAPSYSRGGGQGEPVHLARRRLANKAAPSPWAEQPRKDGGRVKQRVAQRQDGEGADSSGDQAAGPKPINLHLSLSMDQPGYQPGSAQQHPAGPQPRGKAAPRQTGSEKQDAADHKHIVINNFYHHLAEHAPPGRGPSDAPDSGDALAPGRGPEEEEGVEGENAAVLPPGSTTTPTPSLAPRLATGQPGSASATVEPLDNSDLETYLGSDLHDPDDTKPVVHANQTKRKLQVDRKRKRAPTTARPARAKSNAAAPRSSHWKRCFSIVIENKVKRYKETPC